MKKRKQNKKGSVMSMQADLFETIEKRRSVRNFSDRPVDRKIEDAAILIDHMYLVSCAYGLGACMVGEVLDEFDTNYGRYLKERWKIPANYSICSFLLLGYPKGDYPSKPGLTSHPYPEVIFEEGQ